MGTSYDLVFEYFFAIGMGLSLSAAATFFPSYVLFRFLKKFFDRKGW